MAINFLNTVAVDESVLFVDTVNDRVGIGTTGPGEKLTVSGDGRFTNGSSGTLTIKHNYGYHQPNWGIKLNGDTGTTGGYLSQYINLGGFALEQGGTYYGGGSWKTDANSTSYSSVNGLSGQIVFYTNTSLTADTAFNPSERMRINAAGNVGIGTTSPERKLHVEGGYYLKGGAANTSYVADGLWGATATPNLLNSTSGNLGLRIGYQDNGTGLYSPAYGFEVKSTDGIPVAGRVQKAIVIKDVDTGLYPFYINNNGSAFFDGNVGIGTTSPDAKLSVVGETSTNNLIGGSINLATSSGWVIPSGAMSTRVGYYGGNFTLNGATAENGMEWGLGPFNDRQLLWTTAGSTDNNSDGGWNKTLTNLDIDSPYLSVVYFKRVSSNASGSFYHGTGNNILNLDGTSNTNPYFTVRALSLFDQDVWYASVGVIQSNSDSNTTAYQDMSGLYRLDTGVKVSNANTYKFASTGATLTRGHRTYLYYSTDTSVVGHFANPGFYKIDGDQPKLHDIVSGDSDDVFWSANGNDIYNDNSGRVGIGTTTPQRELDVFGGVRIRGTLDLFQENDNTFAGTNAGNLFNIVSSANTGFGEGSQAAQLNGNSNSSLGFDSLAVSASGNNNTAIGTSSMVLSNGGSFNTALGSSSLSAATLGQGNTAIGFSSLANKTTSNFNTAVGNNSLKGITTGFRNTAVGNEAGRFIADGTTANTTGRNSVFIGDGAKANADNQTNQIVIGVGAVGNGSNTTTIGNADTVSTEIKGNVFTSEEIGIGVTNPSAKLQIFRDHSYIADSLFTATSRASVRIRSSRTDNAHLVISQGDSGCTQLQVSSDNATTPRNIKIQPFGGNVGIGTGTANPSDKLAVMGNVVATNFILSSDERKKTKIKDLTCNNIDVNWRSFELKQYEGEYRTGVIAQELEQSHPEFVRTDNEGFKSVKYIDLLIAKIAELEARLEKLEK